jgi:hypothetical protein
MVRYKRQENQLIIFADDTHPRWITTATILDFDTVATADKFGNIAVVRCYFVSSVALFFWISPARGLTIGTTPYPVHLEELIY